MQEAADWASSYLGRQVTVSNISYLIQYGRVRKYRAKSTLVSKKQLKAYYDSEVIPQEKLWKQQLGEDINWELSFSDVRESERTKHVHRLHPYKGKYIPQLVEHFLSQFFKKKEIILDPFVGSGTTLVQCLELGLHSIGIDISRYNCIISKVKTAAYDLQSLETILLGAAESTNSFSSSTFSSDVDQQLDEALSTINRRFYPREYKQLIDLLRHQKQDAETELKKFLQQTSVEFDFTFDASERNISDFTQEYSKAALAILNQELNAKPRSPEQDSESNSDFLQTWFVPRQQEELKHYNAQIEIQENERVRNLMRVILSRTARSCRATTHSDLATLVKPQYEPYYCTKHYKLCRPVSTIVPHLLRYTKDTMKRLKEFSELKKDVFTEVINADSSTVNVFSLIQSGNPTFAELLSKEKLAGVFTSPPYVGQIDYHEQHAYAYELFAIERRDELEIGSKSNGVSRRAQEDYIEGISGVLRNISQFLRDEALIFIVANDQRNLYPEIASRSDFKIEEVFRRPVLNRTERDKQPYSESIFRMVKV
jgi:DNA modification methylase